MLDSARDDVAQAYGYKPDHPSVRSLFTSLTGGDAAATPEEDQPSQYNHFHVEDLLAGAGILLDRCLRHRSGMYDAEAKAIEYALQRALEVSREPLEDREHAAGSLTLRADITHARLAAVVDAHASALEAADKLAKTAGWWGEKGVLVAIKRGVHKEPAKESTEWWRWEAEEYRYRLERDRIGTARSVHGSHLMTLAWEAQPDLAARVRQLETTLAETAAARHKLDRRARRERANLARTEGGGLNYVERAAECRRLFAADWNHAEQRLRHARHGMQSVFGVEDPLPDFAQPKSVADVVAWWQRQAQRVAGLATWDQEFVFRVRVQIGESATLPPEHQTSFEISRAALNAAFGPLWLIRLRGLQVTVVGKEGVHPDVRATLVLPGEATAVGMAGKAFLIDQTHFPRCVFGRVRRTDTLDDYFEAHSCWNASPVGSWGLALSGDVAATAQVVVDMKIAARAQP